MDFPPEELPSLDFSEFLAEPLARSDIIAENQELMYQWNEVDYCLLVGWQATVT